MTSSVRSLTAALAFVAIGSTGLTGCASMNRTEKGTVIGASTGAAVGAVVGRRAGSTATGAILGAVVGGAAGAVIGRQMDRQAAELERDLENAEVERIGEGIKVTFPSGILFDFNSSTLRSTARANLQDLARTLQQNQGSEVLIVGHTDAVGSDEYNQRLSEQRAQSAASYLRSLGISSSRVRTMGMGEREPIASNDTEAGRQENRRVEVAIFASEDYRNQVQRQTGGI